MTILSFSDSTNSYIVLANMLDYTLEMRDGCRERLERLQYRLRALGRVVKAEHGTASARRGQSSRGLIRFGGAYQWCCAVCGCGVVRGVAAGWLSRTCGVWCYGVEATLSSSGMGCGRG